MTLRIISTREIVFDGEVTSVTLPGSEGAFTVLDRHASLISTLVAGKISYKLSADAQEPEEMAINGGIADIDNDTNTVAVCIY